MKIRDRVIIKDKSRLRRDPDMSRLIGMSGTIIEIGNIGIGVRFDFGAMRYFTRYEIGNTR